MTNIIITGAGRGETSILKAIHGLDLVTVRGIYDVDANAPGIKIAKELGIKVFHDLNKIIQLDNIDLIIKATGNKKV